MFRSCRNHHQGATTSASLKLQDLCVLVQTYRHAEMNKTCNTGTSVSVPTCTDEQDL